VTDRLDRLDRRGHRVFRRTNFRQSTRHCGRSAPDGLLFLESGQSLWTHEQQLHPASNLLVVESGNAVALVECGVANVEVCKQALALEAPVGAS